MILGLRTSEPTCHMTLLRAGKIIAQKEWLAERRLSKVLLEELEAFLQENHATFNQLKGLVVFRGPGSYTGLRIGISVMNALAYGLSVPIAGETGENWLEKTQARLQKGENDKIVIPEYGGLPNITSPSK